MARPLVRLAVEGIHGIPHILVVCAGCASEIVGKAKDDQRPYWVREYGNGDCEVCAFVSAAAQ